MNIRSFIREKKIYCGDDYLEVDIFNYTKSEAENARKGERSKKTIESSPRQINLNDINSRRRFIQIVETNFGDNDLHLTLTYNKDNLPNTIEDAERELKNFLRRVSYKRDKEGLPPLKYISIPACAYKKDGVTPARIHHHVILNGGLERDALEDLWRKRKARKQPKGEKIGYANADRLQPDGENGLSALCEYLSKQSGGKKRWSSSQNLDKPEKEVNDQDKPIRETTSRFSASANLKRPWSRTNDYKFNRKEVEKIAKDPPGSAYWERRYPGYGIIGGDYGFEAVYSDSRGWALYLKLRRVK